jgi:hypothetical protein
MCLRPSTDRKRYTMMTDSHCSSGLRVEEGVLAMASDVSPSGTFAGHSRSQDGLVYFIVETR